MLENTRIDSGDSLTVSWYNKNMKKGFIVGFLIGALVLPGLTVLGLGMPYFEYVKPLTYPGLWASRPFQKTTIDMQEVGNIETGEWQTVPVEAVHITPLAWIVYLGVNGLVYGFIGMGIAAIVRKRKSVNTG